MIRLSLTVTAICNASYRRPFRRGLRQATGRSTEMKKSEAKHLWKAAALGVRLSLAVLATDGPRHRSVVDC